MRCEQEPCSLWLQIFTHGSQPLTFNNLKLAFLSGVQEKSTSSCRLQRSKRGLERHAGIRPVWLTFDPVTFSGEDSSSSKTRAFSLRAQRSVESARLARMCRKLIFTYANEICGWCTMCLIVLLRHSLSFSRSSVFILVLDLLLISDWTNVWS